MKFVMLLEKFGKYKIIVKRNNTVLKAENYNTISG